MCRKKKETSAPLRKKSRRNTSKFQKLIHYGLKQKLRCWVLAPLAFGIIFTVGVSFAIILYVEPLWFSMTSSEIIKNQQNSMLTLTQSLSDYMRDYMQRIINDLLFINDYTNKVLTQDPFYYYSNKQAFAFNLLLTTNASITEPFFNQSPLYNLGFFSWYLNNQTLALEQTTNPITLQNFIYSVNTDSVIRPIYRNAQRIQLYENQSAYQSIYHIFDNDEFFYLYPCPTAEVPFQWKFFPMDAACLQAKNTTFSITCYEFYLQSKMYAEEYGAYMNIKSPYLISYPSNMSANILETDVILGITVCSSIMEPTNSSKLKMMTCIDANITDLKYSVFESSASLLGSVTVLGYLMDALIGEVVLRNDLNVTFFLDSKLNSFIEMEFQVPLNSTSEDATNFIKMYNESYTEDNGPYINIYQKKGANYLLAISHVSVLMGYDASQTQEIFSLVFSISENDLLANFDLLRDQVQKTIITQLAIIGAVIFIILAISLCTINYIADSIVSPMDDLVIKVQKLQDGDDEVDIIENFTEKSYEINCLYLTFSKLANVLKYANNAFFEGNDAEALIRYAQALKLFSDLNNRKAMASIYNNIGNIHLLGERYEEAIENYKQSVQITEEELKKTAKIQKMKQPKDAAGSKSSKFIDRDSKGSGNMRYSNLQHSLKNDKKLSNSDSRDSKSSMINLGNPSETKAMFETQISNREYQLVNALILQAEKKKINNWEEVIRRLNRVLRIDLEYKKNGSRLVKTHLLTSNALLEIGDFKKSAQHIYSAEEKLREYANMFSQQIVSEREIPPDILNQKVYLQKGMLLKKIGKTKSAAEKFTQCLELGDVYDPEIRRRCLEQLKEIFDTQGMLENIPNIPKLLENTVSKKNKDIVFALDYSESMNQPGRLQHATKAIVTIYDDYVKDNDRVGYIKFNKNVDVIFGLSERGKNRVYLRKCLQNVEEVIKPHGETAFFTAIKESLKLHKKAERRDHSRWIVALTDGEDNSSRIKYDEIYKRLKNSDINLIIVGLALDEKIIPLLRELCLATPEGVFIETPVSNDLDIAFQSITDIIYGTSDIIIESWS